jgi:hypothetical protein
MAWAWYQQETDLKTIAERLNAHPAHGKGRRWNWQRVRSMLSKYADRAQYSAIAARHKADSMARASRKRALAATRNDEKNKPYILELFDTGMTLARISHELANLKPDPVLNSADDPYSTQKLWKLIVAWRGSTRRPRRRNTSMPVVRLGPPGKPWGVLGADGRYHEKPPITKSQHTVIKAILDAGPRGLHKPQLQGKTGGAMNVLRGLVRDPDVAAILRPAERGGPGYRFVPPKTRD